MVIAVIFFMAVCWQSVDSTEIPIITRDTYDLVRFPKCGGGSNENFKCADFMVGSISTGDKMTCTCQCSGGYVTYRDPYVIFKSTYKYDFTRKGCTWYSNYHGGCDVLQSVGQVVGGSRKFRKPIIIDLTRSGSMVLKKNDFDQRPLDSVTITPYVRTPAKNQWENITDISFDLTFINTTGDLELFKLQWTPNSSNIYAHQGLVMRLDLRHVNQDQKKGNCIMTKIEGTFTEAKSCRRHTVDGRCCIFPFVYKNTLYNDCATTDDMKGSWCAVGLNTNVNEGNHKWRENCADSIYLPTTSSSPVKTKKIAHSVPALSSQLPTSTAKTSTQQITPEPATNQMRRSSVFPTATVSQLHISSTTPQVQSLSDRSADGKTIIAIVVALLVFFVAVVILVIVYLRCRRTSAKRQNEETSERVASTMEVNDAIHLEETRYNMIIDGPDPIYEYPNAYEPLRNRSRDVEHTYQGLLKTPKEESKAQTAGDYFEGHNQQNFTSSTYERPLELYEQLGEERQDEENQLYYQNLPPPAC